MMRKGITRALAGLLSPVLLLASCAAGQKHVDSMAETQIANTGSPASAQATEAPLEEWKYDETYFDEPMAEAGPDEEPGTSPREAEQEKSDEKTRAGKVATRILLGTLLLAFVVALTILVPSEMPLPTD